MRISAVFALGLAAFVMANPVPEAEAGVAGIEEKRGLADSLAVALPHPVGGVDKIMSSLKPSDLITRQAKKGLFLQIFYFHC